MFSFFPSKKCSPKYPNKDNCILGEGAYGVVTRIICAGKDLKYCRDRSYVAKKIITVNNNLKLPLLLSSIKIEMRALKKLEKKECPYILKIYDNTVNIGNKTIITQYLEYIHGLELNDYYEQYNEELNMLENKKSIIIGLFKGLKVIHDNNILHCDIRPTNIIIKTNTIPAIPVYIDFGLSKILESRESIITREGTTEFILSREYVTSRRTARSDIYALMLTLWLVYNNNYSFGETFGITREHVTNILNQYYNEIPTIFDKICNLFNEEPLFTLENLNQNIKELSIKELSINRASKVAKLYTSIGNIVNYIRNKFNKKKSNVVASSDSDSRSSQETDLHKLPAPVRLPPPVEFKFGGKKSKKIKYKRRIPTKKRRPTKRSKSTKRRKHTKKKKSEKIVISRRYGDFARDRIVSLILF